MKNLLFALILCFILAACSPAATAAPSVTLVPVATNTTAPSPTWTPLPPTDTPLPPPNTPLPPTETPLPPTDTPLPPTDTPEPQVEIACPSAAKLSNERVTLTILNKSGQEISMKLDSCDGSTFQYLTIPAGDAANPTEKMFKLQKGSYKRATWQCQGLETHSVLNLDGNIRLTFTPCDAAPAAPSVTP